MKWMCVILVFSGPTPERTEKAMESHEECLAWKYQQHFAPAVPTPYDVLYFCEPYWEA